MPSEVVLLFQRGIAAETGNSHWLLNRDKLLLTQIRGQECQNILA
ncbi:hypothetical protein YPPY54_3255, partial [Yersinia pestis PY-54]